MEMSPSLGRMQTGSRKYYCSLCKVATGLKVTNLKELYEPIWDDLQEKMREQYRRIRSIWIADVVEQGQSGVLNESMRAKKR